MLILTGTKCESGDVRATLSHDWLKKQLLRGIAILRETKPACSANGPTPPVIVNAADWLEEATRVADNIIEDYSPARLIEGGPLSSLPDDLQRVIKEAVHKAYLDLGFIQALADEVTSAIAELRNARECLVKTWEPATDATMRYSTLDRLEEAAIRLKRSFDALPDGVILP